MTARSPTRCGPTAISGSTISTPPTVYNKGAELVRMIHTLLGTEGFRRGMDLYIRRHDNRAATIEDFVAAMQDAGGVDLGRFKLWYAQAGTPEITVEDHWDEASRSYELSVAQKVPPTPGQPEKSPMLTPLAIGLLGSDGGELPTRLEGEPESRPGTRVLSFREERQTFRFVDVPAAPVPSLLRGFSAPVKFKGVALDRLKFLAVHDPEPFARWEAGQEVATRALLDRIEALRAVPAPAPLDPDLVAAMRQTLAGPRATRPSPPRRWYCRANRFSPTRWRLSMSTPSIGRGKPREPKSAARSPKEFADAYASLADPGPYRIDGTAIGRRALRNASLAYIAAADPEKGAALAKAQFDAAANMTDVLAALAVLADLDRPERPAALAHFFAVWSHDPLVIDKWFGLQARSSLPDTPARVRALASTPPTSARTRTGCARWSGPSPRATRCAFTMRAAPDTCSSPTKSLPSIR